MDIQRQIIYLAALLHDIGKFYQRADDNGMRRSVILDREVKELESVYCPQYNGRYSHKHVIWTAQFIADFEPLFKHLFGDQFNRFFAAAVGHHKPDPNDLLQMVVQLADHYASGVDRTKKEGQQDAEHEGKWDDFKNVRMCSIFEGLLRSNVTYQYRLPIAPLELKETFFPRKPAGFSTAAKAEYQFLWAGFVKEVQYLKGGHFDSLINTILALLQKHTITVPSSTQHLPDVSLFDHLKSTAAMALCLYDYLQAGNRQNARLSDDEKPLLLIGADISGIQAFIYDIVGRNAAKNLKGRSFYLQLLVDSVLQRILKALNLYEANVVYASGGGFYILAPNIDTIREALIKLTAEIQNNLFGAHQVSLYLAIDSEGVSQGQIFGQKINEAWSALSQKLNEQKRRRFHRQLATQYDYFFSPYEVGGVQLRDVITNEEISEGEIQEKQVTYLDADDNLQTQPVKESTYLQIELGRTLRDADYLVSSPHPVKYWKEGRFEPADLGIHHYFFSNSQLRQLQTQLQGSADGVRITAINRTDFVSDTIAGSNNTHSFTLYGGNRFPEDEKGAPKLFDQLAGESETNFKRLGVLRMDVDNLGQIFVRGLGETQRTFSRYSTLSRSLDYFFRGYLNEIWNANEQLRNYTYIVYAGGDDLFIVGKWDCLINFAKEIYNHFRRWSCANPALGLSGGIAIVTGKFPIAKGASLAEEAEKLAKNYACEGLEKNAFGLMGYALNWEIEFPVVEGLKKDLVGLMKGGDAPRSLLGKISALYEMSRLQREKGRNESWRWMIAYDFARAKERYKRNEALKNFLNQTQQNVFADTHNGQKLKGKYGYLELLNLAARWAELELRSTQND